MAERKYEKYIIKEDKTPPPPAEMLKRLEEQRKTGNYTESTHMFHLTDAIAKGAFYVDAVWMWDQKGTGGVYTEISHAHDWDEVWVFAGTDREHPKELGAVLDFYLGDEQYVIDKSCIVYIPRGLPHGPCGMRKIDRPLLFITMGNGSSYTRSAGNET
jgi:mannose-6-phosphate isomerase-like protein (cupin superfamily)